jgi:hypothetical protein
MHSVPSIFIWSAGSALAALGGMIIAHRLVKPIDLEKHQPFLDATLNIVGTLVSILLGLLVAASLNNYQTLEGDVEAEATSVAEVGRLSFGLPTEKQHEIMQQCLDYCDQVANVEWPDMEIGRVNIQTYSVYLKLLKTIVTYNPTTNGQTNIHNAMLSAVQTVGDYRRHRLLWLQGNRNEKLMPVIFMCALIVLVFAYLYVQRSSFILHCFLICFVATALGANIGLVVLLSNPFKGDWKIQPTGFQVNSQIIRQLTGLH